MVRPSKGRRLAPAPDYSALSFISGWLTLTCRVSVAVHNDQPEQDSLNDTNPVPEQTTTAPEVNKQRCHSRPSLRSGRALLGILTSGTSTPADMLDHTESL
jgi:hypothetical protein